MRARLRIVLLTTAFILGVTGLPATFAATSPVDDDTVRSLLGSYLAANFAKNENDPDNATTFYRSALSLDPSNEVLMEQAFQTEATEANWKRAVPSGGRARQQGSEQPHGAPRARPGSLQGARLPQAEKEFEAASDGLIGELTSALARSWTAVAAGDARSRA